MNIYLLQLIAKWVGVLFMSFVSLFDISGYNEKSLEVSNLNFRKSSDIVNQVISYDTKYIYNSNLSSDTKLVRQTGENGIVYVKLLGACVGCTSADLTLRDGIEALLLEEVPGVIGVFQVLD